MTDPIEEKFKEMMNGLAQSLDQFLNPDANGPKKVGFLLCLFDLSEGPNLKENRFNYISNSQRMDITASLKEIIAHNEGRLHPPLKGQ